LDAYIARTTPFEKGSFKAWLSKVTADYVETPLEGLIFIFSAVIVLLVIESVLQFYQTYMAKLGSTKRNPRPEIKALQTHSKF